MRAWSTLAAAIIAPVCAEAATYDDIQPLLAERCVICHQGQGAPLGLVLDSYAAVLAGSKRGPVVVPGAPESSELVRRLRGTSQPRMPLTGPPYLSEEQISLFEQWISGGAPRGKADASAFAPPPRRPGPGEPVLFGDVRGILLQRCVKCHRDNGQMGRPPEGLRLDTLERVLSGGERIVVIPGNPGASELMRRVRGFSRPRMPFDGPPYLSDEEVRLLNDWIAQGARSNDGVRATIPAGGRVRFEGTLTGIWEVDGTRIELDGGTRVKKSPRVGDRVEVRGVVNADGSIRATRLRRR